MRRAEHDLLAAWHIHAKVTLCSVAVPSTPRSFWNHYVRPATVVYLPRSSTQGLVGALDSQRSRPPSRVAQTWCPFIGSMPCARCFSRDASFPRCSWISTTLST